jgi:hypothetical protein
MWNARPLAEFNQSGWIQVDFAPLINYRRKEERRHVAKLHEDIFDQEMSGESIQKIFEKEREEDDEGWIDQFDNMKICNEGREEYNRDEPSDSKDKWEKIGLKLEGYSLCAIVAHVTPSFKGKTECIDHVCARIKLHTRLDIVNTKISATRIKSYYKP